MKTIVKLLVFAFVLSLNGVALGQDESAQGQDQEYEPVYITMTTTHWSDDPDADLYSDHQRDFTDQLRIIDAAGCPDHGNDVSDHRPTV